MGTRWYESRNITPVWPVDWPSRCDGYLCGSSTDPYWLVTVSGFQGSGAARGYVTCLSPRCQPLISTDFRRFARRPSGEQNAPAPLSRGRRMPVGFQLSWLPPPFSDHHLTLLSYQSVLRLRRLGEAAGVIYHSVQDVAIAKTRTLCTFCVSAGQRAELISAYATRRTGPLRSAACRLAQHVPQARSKVGYTHPRGIQPALRRS